VRKRTYVFAVLAGLGGAARANPAGQVPGSVDADPDNPVQVLGSVDYEYEADSSQIMREHVGDPSADPNAPLPVQKDLEFKQFKHTITPRVQIGIYHDVFVNVALPIVVTQARELHLDGISRDMSSTVQDGILPMQGYDARDPTAPPPGDLLFRGVDRHGLDQIELGLGFAPMNQQHDDTKPTWKIGADVLLAIGGIAKFDPAHPTANSHVGEGVSEMRVWTSFDRQLGWAEPWAYLWWQVPLANKSDSLFQDPGFGATNVDKGQQAGAAFGLEVYAVDDKANKNRISLDLGTRMTAHFEGRAYSEMWEVFAYAGDSRGSGPLILDADPTKMGIQALSHPGISNVENYLETSARLALRARLGTHVSFAAIGEGIWKTDHVISFADAGVDLPTCTGSETTHCEANDNDLVNPGTEEVNPLHSAHIDLVGHRYRSVNNFGFLIGIQGQVVF
jgi:hypothetical protein